MFTIEDICALIGLMIALEVSKEGYLLKIMYGMKMIII